MPSMTTLAFIQCEILRFTVKSQFLFYFIFWGFSKNIIVLEGKLAKTDLEFEGLIDALFMDGYVARTGKINGPVGCRMCAWCRNTPVLLFRLCIHFYCDMDPINHFQPLLC
jgi:hypothetical protein